MSLLDLIGEAEGEASANYLKGGRHVIRISRVTYREPTALKPQPGFRIDGDILWTSSKAHAAEIGLSGTMNLNFKFPPQDLARTRRALAAAVASMTGEKCDVSKIDGKTSKELCGEGQPLTGAVITIVANEKPQQKNPEKSFTTYEAYVPSEQDLANVEAQAAAA